MTKLGFVIKGAAAGRSLEKRRKSGLSTTNPQGKRTTYTVVHNKDGRIVMGTIGSRGAVYIQRMKRIEARCPELVPITTEISQQISYRMLNTLEDRMKEEKFDVIE
ncbi:hypothetical protein SFB10_3558 [Serratia liquefaciens]|uniref:hypothetical protein n=1 Tax=Serratia liquefaciens TaxID=614 RepID=UPI00141C2C08|nr:hypothetical protein [Serratia liquefaciens]CAB1223435.1 hypothetical protein SFB10_3558 [Serratia liquefaciens]CAI2037067.1 Uncharacterised protein [Serratia liquefaciens]